MITVYTKPACMQCNATKRALDKHEAVYQMVDVTESPEAVAHVKALGYSAMPVVTVDVPDGLDHWTGYVPEKIAAAAYLQKEGI
jgi:glutaredoxin-like protein NrdH